MRRRCTASAARDHGWSPTAWGRAACHDQDPTAWGFGKQFSGSVARPKGDTDCEVTAERGGGVL